MISNLLVNLTLILGQIVAPETAPVGSPVLIKAQVTGEFVLDLIPKHTNDSILEVSDRNGLPVIVFWSQIAGPRTIILATTDPLKLEYKTLKYGSGPGPGPEPNPPVPGPEPPEPYKTRVAPLVSFVNATGVKDKHLKLLVEFYSDFADVVESDTGIIATNKNFRDAYIKAGKLFFKDTGVHYPGLSGIVDKVIVNTLGLDIVAFEKDKAVKALKAISWAFNEGL